MSALTQPVTTRPARPGDAAAMCALLNRIIAIGGTTAYEVPFDPPQMIADYILKPRLICSTVAEIDGALVGFQSLSWPEPGHDAPDSLPADWAYIATFVQAGMTGKGIGSALFTVTRAAARAAGAVAIDATIRADNAGGLTYYGKMGFVDYDVLRDVPLRSGRPVDRIRKRITP